MTMSAHDSPQELSLMPALSAASSADALVAASAWRESAAADDEDEDDDLPAEGAGGAGGGGGGGALAVAALPGALCEELARQTQPALCLLEACAREDAAGAVRVARLRAALRRLQEAPHEDAGKQREHAQHDGELHKLAQLLELAPAMAARARHALARLQGLAARAAACEEAAAKLRAAAEASVRAVVERRERESALDASVRVAAGDATLRRSRQAASKTVRKKQVELDL